MDNVLERLYETVLERRDNPSEGSYTRYLFDSGLDKILKKCGEECSEVIIAAKNGNNADTVGEIADLIYHLWVLMAAQGIPLGELTAALGERAAKTGNLKRAHVADKNT